LIINSQSSEPTPMCNVELVIEQPHPTLVCEEPVLIIEQFPTRIVRTEQKNIDIAHLVRDPDNQPQIGNTQLINKMKFKGHTLI